jgi:hypothetical protein
LCVACPETPGVGASAARGPRRGNTPGISGFRASTGPTRAGSEKPDHYSTGNRSRLARTFFGNRGAKTKNPRGCRGFFEGNALSGRSGGRPGGGGEASGGFFSRGDFFPRKGRERSGPGRSGGGRRGRGARGRRRRGRGGGPERKVTGLKKRGSFRMTGKNPLTGSGRRGGPSEAYDFPLVGLGKEFQGLFQAFPVY